MNLQQITAADIAGWDSLDDIAESLEKRGLKPRRKLCLLPIIQRQNLKITK